MRQRPVMKFHPGLEQFEEKQLLSASPIAAHGANHVAETSATAKSRHVPGSLHLKQGTGYFAYRITNPTYREVNLKPPFLQALIQRNKPIPGKTYNVLFVVVKNGTSQTFTASDGLTARVPGTSAIPPGTGQKGIPILTGNEEWKPGQWIVLYALSHKYYPLSPQVGAAIQIQAGGRSSTMVPGPSGIFLRLKYKPATFSKTLDWIVAYSQGAQIGNGSALGMPDTAVNILVSAGTKRIDFAGHF